MVHEALPHRLMHFADWAHELDSRTIALGSFTGNGFSEITHTSIIVSP